MDSVYKTSEQTSFKNGSFKTVKTLNMKKQTRAVENSETSKKIKKTDTEAFVKGFSKYQSLNLSKQPTFPLKNMVFDSTPKKIIEFFEDIANLKQIINDLYSEINLQKDEGLYKEVRINELEKVIMKNKKKIKKIKEIVQTNQEKILKIENKLNNLDCSKVSETSIIDKLAKTQRKKVQLTPVKSEKKLQRSIFLSPKSKNFKISNQAKLPKLKK